MTDITVLKGNTIELHYWFNDNSHTMNAIVFNKCEYEFLGIAKEISQKLKVDIETKQNRLVKVDCVVGLNSSLMTKTPLR